MSLFLLIEKNKLSPMVRRQLVFDYSITVGVIRLAEGRGFPFLW